MPGSTWRPSAAYDEAEGVELEIRAPGAVHRRAQAARGRPRGHGDPRHPRPGARARSEGHDIVGVMAFVQRPLAAVLAQPAIRSPEGPRGRARRRDAACRPTTRCSRSIVAGDGGDPARVRKTTIGFQAVKALLAGRVAGATAFWNVEGVALRRAAARDAGVPRRRLRRARLSRAGAVRDARDARGRRAGAARDDPRAAARLRRGRSAIPRARSRRCARPSRGSTARRWQRELDAVDAAFTAGARAFGELRPDVLRAWASWDVEFGILREPPDVDRAFDTSLVGPVADILTRGVETALQARRQALDQRGALAGHARARHDQVEARRLGAQLDVVVHVRVDAERRACPPARPPPAAARPARRRRIPRSRGRRPARRRPTASAPRAASCASWPAAVSIPSTLEPSSRSSKTATTRATLLRADAAELLAHGLAAAPHLHGLHAPGAQLAQHELAADPGVVEQLAACRASPARRRRGRTGGRRGSASASRGASRAAR